MDFFNSSIEAIERSERAFSARKVYLCLCTFLAGIPSFTSLKGCSLWNNTLLPKTPPVSQRTLSSLKEVKVLRVKDIPMQPIEDG